MSVMLLYYFNPDKKLAPNNVFALPFRPPLWPTCHLMVRPIYPMTVITKTYGRSQKHPSNHNHVFLRLNIFLFMHQYTSTTFKLFFVLFWVFLNLFYKSMGKISKINSLAKKKFHIPQDDIPNLGFIYKKWFIWCKGFTLAGVKPQAPIK